MVFIGLFFEWHFAQRPNIPISDGAGLEIGWNFGFVFFWLNEG